VRRNRIVAKRLLRFACNRSRRGGVLHDGGIAERDRSQGRCCCGREGPLSVCSSRRDLRPAPACLFSESKNRRARRPLSRRPTSYTTSRLRSSHPSLESWAKPPSSRPRRVDFVALLEPWRHPERAFEDLPRATVRRLAWLCSPARSARGAQRCLDCYAGHRFARSSTPSHSRTGTFALVRMQRLGRVMNAWLLEIDRPG